MADFLSLHPECGGAGQRRHRFHRQAYHQHRGNHPPPTDYIWSFMGNRKLIIFSRKIINVLCAFRISDTFDISDNLFSEKNRLF